MEPAELQAAFDKLTVEHADLQARFSATAGLILEMQEKHAKELKAEKDDHACTKAALATMKKGFDTQSRNHETAMRRVKELTADGPA